MLSEQIIGNAKEKQFQGKTIDYVEFQWDEVFKKLHRKTSQGGVVLGIHLDDSILTRGLKEDDVLAAEGNTVFAVHILPCEAIVVKIISKERHSFAKVCYEIGNRHAALFWGEEDSFVTPYNEPMLIMLKKIPGTEVKVQTVLLDFERRISASVHAHTH